MNNKDDKEKSVTKLSQFLQLFEDESINIDNYYFRGESNFYDNRSSSLYRDMIGQEYPIDFDLLLTDYYENIGGQISHAEKDNFIAYSQHHGLRTPLLDITTAPLTALYFATETNSDDCGYIYLYNKNKTINISDSLRGFKNVDVLNHLVTMNDPIFIGSVYSGLVNIFNKNISFFLEISFNLIDIIVQTTCRGNLEKLKDEFLKVREIKKYTTQDQDTLANIEDHQKFNVAHLNLQKIHNFQGMTGDLPDIFKTDYESIIKTLGQCSSIKQTSNESLDAMDITSVDELNKLVINYMLMLKIYFKYLRDNTLAFEIRNLDIKLPFFIYKPTYLFDRMKSQNGLFFYQLAVKKRDRANDIWETLSQDFTPDLIIKIEDKKQIRKQLHYLGVSKKSIFPDPDNIASYLNEEHSTSI